MTLFLVRSKVKEMIKLRNKLNELSRRKAVPRRKPDSKFTEPLAKVYPTILFIPWIMYTEQTRTKKQKKTATKNTTSVQPLVVA